MVVRKAGYAGVGVMVKEEISENVWKLKEKVT